MYTSFGFLEYSNSGWIVLKCCEDLAKYYRRSLRKKCLSSPPFGSHLTVSNGNFEYAVNSTAWKKYENEPIEFSYSNEIQYQDGYYWLTIECNRLHDIREELGLSRNLKWPLHLTIAKEPYEGVKNEY